MGSPSLTKRLQDAQRGGREIMAYTGTGLESVPVTYNPDNPYSPRPWVDSAGRRYSARDCYAHLPTDTPVGARVAMVPGRRRVGTYAGPDPDGPLGTVLMNLDGARISVLRRNLRRVVEG